MQNKPSKHGQKSHSQVLSHLSSPSKIHVRLRISNQERSKTHGRHHDWRTRQNHSRFNGWRPKRTRSCWSFMRHVPHHLWINHPQHFKRHRYLLHESSAWCMRRNHTIQLPSHVSSLDVPLRHHLRKHLRPQTFRKSSRCSQSPRQIASRNQPSSRSSQHRSGRIRDHPTNLPTPRHQSSVIRWWKYGWIVYLWASWQDRKKSSMQYGSQEPCHHYARCR